MTFQPSDYFEAGEANFARGPFCRVANEASIAATSEEVAFPFACHLRVTSHDDADLIDLAKGV